MDILPVIAVAASGFIAFFALWLLVVGLIASLSGWRSTAKKYPDSAIRGPETGSYQFQSVRFGFLGNYNFVIQIALYGEGLRLKPIMFYTFMHRPIFIPWGAVQNAEQGQFIFPYVNINLGEKKIMIIGKCAPLIYTHVMRGR